MRYGPGCLLSALLAIIHSTAAAQESPQKRRFGSVAENAAAERALDELLDSVNAGMGGVFERPALLLTHSDMVAALRAGTLDAVLVPATVFAEARIHLAPYDAIAVSLHGRERVASHPSLILFDPRRTEATNLRPFASSMPRATAAFAFPRSAAGYYLPMELFDDAGFLEANRSGPSALGGHFELMQVATEEASLDLFFAGAVDVVAASERQLETFLRDPVRRNQTRGWVNELDSSLPVEATPEQLLTLLRSCCVWQAVESTPAAVFLIRENVPDAFRRELEGVLRDFPGAESLDVTGFSTELEDVAGGFLRLESAVEQHRGDEPVRLTASQVVDDIARDVRAHQEVDPEYSPRVAIVLSGGGAAGAYQAGVLSALLSALEDGSATASDRKLPVLRPALVVGTSVGAINAVALALTTAAARSSPERAGLEMWKEIGSRDVLSSSREGRQLFDWRLQAFRAFGQYRLYLGVLTFAIVLCFQTDAFLVLVSSLTPLPHRARWILVAVLVALAFSWRFVHRSDTATIFPVLALFFGAHLILPRYRARLLAFLGPASLATGAVFVACAALSGWRQSLAFLWFGLFALLAGAVSATLVGRWKKEMGEIPEKLRSAYGVGRLMFKKWASRANRLRFGFAAGTLILLPFSLLELLAEDRAVFESARLTATLAERFCRMSGGEPLHCSSASIEEVSARVRDTIARERVDLVLTATDFSSVATGGRPRDVFFASRIPPGMEKEHSEVWVEISENRGRLIEMVIASASIFPGLPPHDLTKLLVPGGARESFRLIDGGYLHNIPIEAALRMRATHLVIVRVQPESVLGATTPEESQPLWTSLLQTFSLLLERAQSDDLHAFRGEPAYVIAPIERTVGVGDFDGRYDGRGTRLRSLAESFELGRRDAETRGFRQVSAHGLDLP